MGHTCPNRHLLRDIIVMGHICPMRLESVKAIKTIIKEKAYLIEE